jgi:hypothetical protein
VVPYQETELRGVQVRIQIVDSNPLDLFPSEQHRISVELIARHASREAQQGASLPLNVACATQPIRTVMTFSSV